LEDDNDDDATQVDDSILSLTPDETNNGLAGDTDNISNNQATASVNLSVSNENESLDDGVTEARVEKNTSKRSKSNPGPYKRIEKKRADEELNILKSLAAAVATPEPMPNLPKQDNSDDEDVIFGRYIVTEMKKITDVRAKLCLKNTITNAIFSTRLDAIRMDRTPIQQVQQPNQHTYTAGQGTQCTSSLHQLQASSQNASQFSSWQPNYSHDRVNFGNEDNVTDINHSSTSYMQLMGEF
jgi:hypothetical protein